MEAIFCFCSATAKLLQSCPILSFIEPIFAWNVPLVALIFLKRSLVFPILLFSSISLHWSLRKPFLSLLAILWNSAFKWVYLSFSPLPSVQSLSHVCCDPMNHSTPSLPVHHQLPESTQTQVHRVGDAIKPSHPLLSPSPPAPNPSQHQSFPMSQLFAWGGQSIGVSASASFLPMNTQDWSPLGWTGWISLQSKGLSGVFPNTTVQKHQFFSTQLSLFFFLWLYIYI